MEKENYVTLMVSDGTEMQAYTARPPKAPKAGIIVFQEAFGVNSYIRSIADRFAEEGYLAIAPELYHRTSTGFEGDYNDFASLAPHTQGLTLEGQEADVRSSYEWLKAEKMESVVTVGFCMGGSVALITNSILPLAASVSFYGAGIVPNHLSRAKSLHGPMLFFWGGKDTHIPRELWLQIPVALDAAGKSHIQVEMSDAGHGFFCDARSAYHKPSADLAWPLVLNFLSQHIG